MGRPTFPLQKDSPGETPWSLPAWYSHLDRQKGDCKGDSGRVGLGRGTTKKPNNLLATWPDQTLNHRHPYPVGSPIGHIRRRHRFAPELIWVEVLVVEIHISLQAIITVIFGLRSVVVLSGDEHR